MADQEVKAPGTEADHVRSNAQVKNARTYRGRSLTHELWKGVANSVPHSPTFLQGLACQHFLKSFHLMEFQTNTCNEFVCFVLGPPRIVINLLTPNVNYSGRTAPLTSKVAFYIFIQQI
jgi:hypothetical protein